MKVTVAVAVTKRASGAESGAVSNDFEPASLPHLWPTLPEDVRRSIAALVALALGNRPHNPQNANAARP